MPQEIMRLKIWFPLLHIQKSLGDGLAERAGAETLAVERSGFARSESLIALPRGDCQGL
jgi:hypothetical protein